jgi:hypothetical protein
MSPSAASPTSLSQHFGCIIAALCELVAVWGAKCHAITPVMNRAWSRLRRTSIELSALLARFRAGKLRVGSAAPRRALAKTRAPAARPPVSLPRRCGWLVRMMPADIGYGVEVASFRARLLAYRSQLTHLLADPEMVALIEAAPQARRLLRPLCNMLGIESVAALLRPADAAPHSADRAPAAAPAGDSSSRGASRFVRHPGGRTRSFQIRSWLTSAPVRR